MVCYLCNTGKKKKALTNITMLASNTLSKAAFLCGVLLEEYDCWHLAFKVGMFGLELPRPPASCKALEVNILSILWSRLEWIFTVFVSLVISRP